MNVTFGNISFSDVWGRIVPISPKPMQLLIGDALEESLAYELIRLRHSKQVRGWKYSFASLGLAYNAQRADSLADFGKTSVLHLGRKKLEIRVAGKEPPELTILTEKPTSGDPISVQRRQVMKTQTNITYELGDLRVNLEEMLKDFVLPNACTCPWETLWANGNWGNAPNLEFICRRCGKMFLCSCFREAVEVFAHETLKSDPNRFQPDTRAFLERSSRYTYRDGICHLCTGLTADFDTVFKMRYTTAFRANYMPYITRELMFDDRYWGAIHDSSMRDSSKLQKVLYDIYHDAENRVRRKVGINDIGLGWPSEAMVFHMVSELFSDQTVLSQASPPWLKGMRFDILLPDLNLAVEYQGIQHYKPVDHFGGQTGFQKTIERDQKKLELSTLHGVKIVYVKFDEEISRERIKKKIDAALHR